MTMIWMSLQLKLITNTKNKLFNFLIKYLNKSIIIFKSWDVLEKLINLSLEVSFDNKWDYENNILLLSKDGADGWQ